MKVCRICLSKDGRLYPITSNGLCSLYHQLTGVLKFEADVDKRLPQWLCAECGLRLLSYDKLRQKSLRSYKILCQFLEKATYITEDDLYQIDRQKNDLKSHLSYVVLNHDVIQEHGEDTQETPNPEYKPKQEIEKYFINIDEGEPSTVFKSEKDSDGCHSENEVSDTAINKHASDSDSEDTCLSSDSSGSVNKLLKNISNTLLKPPDKKVCSNIKKDVNACLNTLNKGSKKVRNVTSKRVRRRAINKQVISKANPYPIEEVFSIETLTFDEQLVQFEKRKYARSYTSALFKCDKCFKGFTAEASFGKHQLLHSDKSGKVECKICKIRFQSIQSSYHNHMTLHKTRYSCRECQYVTSHRPMALLHWSKHKGKTYKCIHCDMEFINQNSYMFHLRIKHVSSAVCEYCGYSFVNNKGVIQHKIIKHGLSKKDIAVITDGPTCEKCNIKFVSDEALHTHIRVAHTQHSDRKRNFYGNSYERNIICDKCGVKSSDSRAYRAHYQRYHQNKANKTKQPIKRGPPQQFMCEQCGQVFLSKSNMLTHVLLHTEQKPYECDYCQKKYNRKQSITMHILRKHLRTSDVDCKVSAKHTCNICGKVFANIGNRKRHMAVHTNLRPFICEICGSSFKTKCDVKLHTKHVHMKVPWPKKHERNTRQ